MSACFYSLTSHTFCRLSLLAATQEKHPIASGSELDPNRVIDKALRPKKYLFKKAVDPVGSKLKERRKDEKTVGALASQRESLGTDGQGSSKGKIDRSTYFAGS